MTIKSYANLKKKLDENRGTKKVMSPTGYRVGDIKKPAPKPAAPKPAKPEPKKGAEEPSQDLVIHGSSFHDPDFDGDLDLNAGLMYSKFCYGCQRFTVDFPGTEKEAGFCFREMDQDDGDFDFCFKKIKPHFTVGRCPLVKEWRSKQG